MSYVHHAILGCQQVQNFVKFKTKILVVKFEHPVHCRLAGPLEDTDISKSTNNALTKSWNIDINWFCVDLLGCF